MQNESRPTLEALFEACRNREPGAERQAYLDGACGDDAELRSRVEALLASHDEATGFLEDPAVSVSREEPGARIGNYKLLQEIGEGGMGVVYMAEQEKPVRRMVAVKVIKLGMDTKQVIARFEAERQALALMDHANIARVLDAGSTDAGRPYFVMELVRGVPISEYCDTHKLATDERLGLFVDVCRAVQHAHQKGIIHRDLKPTNVLVTSHDGTPVPKIIDFGVAKATNQRLTERTLFTEFHQFIGTPEYMSPEQAEMSGLDVDTRSDIYALGVLLYQLLTGTTPVDPTDLRTAGFEEMTRMIREDQPQAPSTRISRLGADGDRIALHRSTDAGSLTRLFRGDLDWIVMKALEKDRTRRYDSASAFAEDVLRHLEDRPVEAGPPSVVYRARKFAHRNRKTVAAVLLLVLVIALGLAGTTAGFLSASAQARRSGAISDSLQDVLAMTDPARAAAQGDVESVLATVREVFGEEHATYAAVLDTLALRLHDAGDFDAASELGRESLGVWKDVHGERHPNTAAALARLGTFLRAQGDYLEAETALRQSLAIRASSPDASGPASHDARIALAELLRDRGEFAAADELLEESLAALRASPTPAHARIIATLEMRAAVQLNIPTADTRETLRALYAEANGFFPDDSPVLAMAALGYGRILFQEGDLEASEPYLREALERYRAGQDASGFYHVVALELVFQLVRGREDPESVRETDELLSEMIRFARVFWSVDDLVKNQRYYAERMVERGRIVAALDAAWDAYRTLANAKRPAEDRQSLRGDLIELSVKVSVDADLAPEVFALARDAMELARLDDPDNAFVQVALGAVLYRQGELDRAAELLDRAQESLGDSRAREARKVAPVLHTFRALVHAALGDEAVAREQLAVVRDALEGGSGGEHGPALVREVEALLERSASSNEGD